MNLYHILCIAAYQILLPVLLPRMSCRPSLSTWHKRTRQQEDPLQTSIWIHARAVGSSGSVLARILASSDFPLPACEECINKEKPKNIWKSVKHIQCISFSVCPCSLMYQVIFSGYECHKMSVCWFSLSPPFSPYFNHISIIFSISN